MGLKLNPITGQFDLTGGGGSGPSSSYTVEQFTLTALQAANKQVTLASAPTTPAATILIIQGGGGQAYSVDYTVSGSTLSWNTLGLDGFLDENDIITVIHD